MKVYETADIRNVVLVGHQGAGKTMLSEAMLFATGGINRMGSITDHSTVSDYTETEHQREMSIFATLVHAEHKGTKLNILDTPGYPDFMGELVASLRVADTALFVLNAVDPVQVGTEVSWGFADKARAPVLFFVNQSDKGGVDFPGVIEKVQARFGRAATVLQIPVGDNSRAVIDLLMMKQLVFPEGKGEPKVVDIDAGFADHAAELRNTLVENVAENDEALMEKYLEQGSLSEEEIQAGLRTAVLKRQLFPILVGSATANFGVTRLMEVIASVTASPVEGVPMKSHDGNDFVVQPSGEPVAFVFRTMSEQHVGEYSLFKVCSGSVETAMDLENAQTGTLERFGGLFVLNGRTRDNVAKLNAGDLGATGKLKDTHTSNTLRPKGSRAQLAPIEFPEPRYKAAIKPTTPGEEDKLSAGLHKMVAEDPSLKIIYVTDLNQMLLGGQGEMHIEIARSRLKSRYSVEVDLTIPKVSYRETVTKSSRSSYRHKKQTGGAGQFADISMILEPLTAEYKPPPDIKVRGTTRIKTDWGAEIEMIDAIVSGVIDMKRFQGAIQKGVLEAMKAGPVAGYPCGDVRVVINDGKMHAVDSNEAAFKTASRQCFKQCFETANPVMLEPMCDLEVLAPDDFTGDVMSDLNTRRARIQGMEAEGNFQRILAQAPEVELLRYSTTLRSLTQGRGLHTARFKQYEAMPRNLQDKMAEEAKKAKEEAKD
jgi:elongation factor G